MRMSIRQSLNNNKKQNKSTKTSTITTWTMKTFTTFPKKRTIKAKVKRHLSLRLRTNKNKAFLKSTWDKSSSGYWSCSRTYNFMRKTTCSQFTKDFWNLTSLWSSQSSSLRSHIFNTIPSSPWQLKSRLTLPNLWKNLLLRRMKSSNKDRVKNRKTTKQIIEEHPSKKALMRKIRVMTMKSILMRRVLMKMRMTLTKINNLMKMTGTNRSSLSLKKLKNPILNLTPIIASKPQKHKNKNTKKESNSTIKWKPPWNNKRKLRNRKKDNKESKTKSPPLNNWAKMKVDSPQNWS